MKKRAVTIKFDGEEYKAQKTKAPLMSFHGGRTWDVLEMNAQFVHPIWGAGFVTRIWADTSWGKYGYFNLDAYATDASNNLLYPDYTYDNRNLPSDKWYKFTWFTDPWS